MKRLLMAALPIFMFIALGLNANAYGSRLTDEAGLLTEAEASAVSDALDTVSAKYDMDICIATVYGRDYNIVDFTDDYYDARYGYDGLLLLIDMEDRSWYISTCGEGEYAFTDAGIDYIGDQIIAGGLSDGNYADAFLLFADLSDEFINAERNGKPYDSGNLPKGPYPLGSYLVISLAVGFIIALIRVSSLKSKLKSVSFNRGAANYVNDGSLKISEERDRFIYSNVVRTAIPSSSSSGGSSTHTSSSGRSHGGGGGHF